MHNRRYFSFYIPPPGGCYDIVVTPIDPSTGAIAPSDVKFEVNLNNLAMNIAVDDKRNGGVEKLSRRFSEGNYTMWVGSFFGPAAFTVRLQDGPSCP